MREQAINVLRARRLRLGVSIAVVAVAVAGVSSAFASSSRTHRVATAAAVKPTIVLVHGAWANPGSWAPVIQRLQADGYNVVAPPDPLVGVQHDAQALRDVLGTINGPIVPVGHSYGGAVITNAAHGVSNVKALVYVDAFAPARGETLLQLVTSTPGSILGGNPTTKYNPAPFPGAPKGAADLYVKLPVFLAGFANGIPREQALIAYSEQAPILSSALTDKSGPPAWKTIPSWYELGTQDKAIPPALQLSMARRIHAHITRVPTGHLAMLADPGAVTNVILQAAHGVG
jgi:pimeloyl-ACP methyl ester carboxylesterase